MQDSEAHELFKAIYAPYHALPAAAQAQSMMQYLEGQRYESIKAVVPIAIKSCKFPPVPAELENIKSQIEAVNRYQTQAPITIAAELVAHQRKLVEMSDEDYMQLLSDRRRGGTHHG